MNGAFFKGLVLGVSISAAGLFGYAYGTNEDRSTEPLHVQAREASGHASCDVQVGWGQLTPGDQCRFDQVMVGVRDNYILCADVEVTCPDLANQ